MTDINPEFVAQVAKIAGALDTLDYFQILRVTPDATADEIRSGYHRQARMFHPDRYHHMGDTGLVSHLTRISKRITEAYVVLRQSDRRVRYRELIASADRAENLRYRERQEDQRRADKEAAHGKTSQGRKLFTDALAAWSRGEQQEAIKGLKMALVYEADNQTFKDLLASWTEMAAT